MDGLDHPSSSSSTPPPPSLPHPPHSTMAVSDTNAGDLLIPSQHQPAEPRDVHQDNPIPISDPHMSSDPESQTTRPASPPVTAAAHPPHPKTEPETETSAGPVALDGEPNRMPLLDAPVPESKLETGSDSGAAALVPQTPQVSLTFLLASGRRRTMSFEPQTTVARVKEFVWNAWPSGTTVEYPLRAVCLTAGSLY